MKTKIYKNNLIIFSMSKKQVIKFLILFLLMNLCIITSVSATENQTKWILFYGDGCPHCAKVESFIQNNNLEDLIIEKEIYHNSTNAGEFNKLCDEKGIGLMSRGVPLLFAENKIFIGDEEIINYLNNFLEKDKINENKQNDFLNTSKNSIKKEILTIPMVISAALVDAINPCAFAVLLILMMTVLATGNRKKALFSGLSFSLSIYISYFLMGLGLYSVVVSFQTSQKFTRIIGIIAIIIGLLNLKDFFWYGKGFLMEVPLSWRPTLKKLIRSVTGPIGAFFIGFLVSLFLLPCTSGPYIVIVGMLGNQVIHNLAIKLLLLYNLIFISPMILITLGTYFGLNVKEAEKKRTKSLRWLHLIAGIIMFLMGFYLVLIF